VIAIEVVGVIDEDGPDAVGNAGVVHCLDYLRAKNDRQLSDGVTCRDAAIARNNDVDIVAEPDERSWKRADHVCQATRFRKRDSLRSNHQYPHPYKHIRKAVELPALSPSCTRLCVSLRGD
jgi:hypothetical protein